MYAQCRPTVLISRTSNNGVCAVQSELKEGMKWFI